MKIGIAYLMTKTIMILAIVAAFVGGTITTGAVAYAAAGGQGDNAIVDAINSLTVAVSGIEPTVTVDQPITVNAPAGPQGEQGIQGIQGEQGPGGPAGPVLNFKTYNVVTLGSGDVGEFIQVPVQCDSGDVALGGSFSLSRTSNTYVSDYPIDENDSTISDGETATGWKLSFIRDSIDSLGGLVTVICYDDFPLRGLPPIIVVP